MITTLQHCFLLGTQLLQLYRNNKYSAQILKLIMANQRNVSHCPKNVQYKCKVRSSSYVFATIMSLLFYFDDYRGLRMVFTFNDVEWCADISRITEDWEYSRSGSLLTNKNVQRTGYRVFPCGHTWYSDLNTTIPEVETFGQNTD